MRLKNLLMSGLIVFVGFGLAGCSGKAQINPTEGNSKDYFDVAKEEERKRAEFIAIGEAQGYAKAKEEIAGLLPYFEAIRASAEISQSGGLCLPPIFIDRTKGGASVVLGDAHLCPEYTIDEIMSMAKTGIPGLPKNSTSITTTEKPQVSGFVVPTVSVVGQQDVFYTKNPEKVQQSAIRRIASTLANREMLRNSNFNFSVVQENHRDGSYLVVTFGSAKDAESFCQKFTICEEKNEKARS